MDTDSILCKILKIHNYINIFDNKRYSVNKCSCCDAYKVIHKEYSIDSKYKHDELPEKFKQLIN